MEIEQLRELINTRAGGSQTKFALMIGKSTAQVNQWLMGRKVMGPKIDRDIENALGITLRADFAVMPHAVQQANRVRDWVNGGTTASHFPDQRPPSSIELLVRELAAQLESIPVSDREIASGALAALAKHPERHSIYASQISLLLKFGDKHFEAETPVEPRAAQGM